MYIGLLISSQNETNRNGKILIMKTCTTLAFVLLMVFTTMGQTREYTEHLSEDFSGGLIPPANWLIESDFGNWGIYDGNKSGGNAPECRFRCNYYNGYTALVSPEIDLTGYSDVTISFKHKLEDYIGTDYVLGVKTRSGGGSWNAVWSVDPEGDIAPTTVINVISTSDVGASDFQFCMFFEGNAHNLDNWFIDDIILYTPLNNDVDLKSVDLPAMMLPGQYDVRGTLINQGISELNSIDIKWQLNDGETYTTTIDGLSVESSQPYDFVCEDQMELDPGDYILKVWCSNMNGIGADDQPSNDLIEMFIGVAGSQTERLVLLEEFTSSTCSPCADFNAITLSSFEEENEDKFVMIKYQMNWPGYGDPYYTEEGGARKDYYSVSGVPNLVANGTDWGFGVDQVQFDEMYDTPSFFVLSANHILDGTNITVNVNAFPFASVPNLKMHVVVVENSTTGNVGTNGEIEFENVMMKMLPDANGTTIDFISGTPYLDSFSADLSGTFIEQFSNLALSVIVFLQDDTNLDVLQASYSFPGVPAPQAYFSIMNGSIGVAIDTELLISFNTPVRNLDNSELTNANVTDHIMFKVDDVFGDDVPFTATISDSKTLISIAPQEEMDLDQKYFVKIDATLENTEDVALESTSIAFTTDSDDAVKAIDGIEEINIYPNPTYNIATLEFCSFENKAVSITVFNMQGLEIESLFDGIIHEGIHRYEIKDLEKGLYVVRFCSEGKVLCKKILIL